MSTATTLPEEIEKLIKKINDAESLTPSVLTQLLKNSDVTPDDLKPWTDFDHPSEDSYGRKLVYKSDKYEMMVMSWNPGDFSAIHDHGFTQWGAVKIFGRAEHATFRAEDGNISTLARWQVKEGETLGVSHSLIHQMGNPTDQPFVSLHVYGDNTTHENITGEARLYDPYRKTIQRVNGGVFFSLPPQDILREEEGPTGDFPTVLRNQVEEINRNLKSNSYSVRDKVEKCFSKSKKDELLEKIDAITDDTSKKVINSIQWKILLSELKAASKLQGKLFSETSEEDQFHKYAEIYDEVIGKPCVETFMLNYLKFFFEKHIDNSEANILSIGCGTGLIEEYMIQELSIQFDNIYGIDISPAMVDEARKRIHADVGDVLTLDPEIKKWDIAYAGLNVFQYLPSEKLEKAIAATASILKKEGYFVGDFITPDHIRWYPNVMLSDSKDVISLRSPELVEINGLMYQESEISNISFLGELMDVHYAGKHLRYLPPVNRVRSYFEKYFGPEVQLYDAVSLDEIKENADSCSSTRYLVIAKKNKD